MIFRRKKQLEKVPAEDCPKTASAENSPSTAPRKKILVADDDPVLLLSLSYKLRAMGYEVVTAGDASQAITSTRQERPDLVLLDVNFPPDVNTGGMQWNGFLLTQWIRRISQAWDMPIIMMSGEDRREYQERSVAVGASGFLPKTMHPDGLRGCINLALSRKAVEAGAHRGESSAN